MIKKLITIITAVLVAGGGGYVVGKGGSISNVINSGPEVVYVASGEADGVLETRASINRYYLKEGILNVKVLVKNISSDKTIESAAITHKITFESHEQKDWSSAPGSGFSNLVPGEEKTVNLNMLVVGPSSSEVVKVEYSFEKGIIFKDEGAPSPPKPYVPPTEDEDPENPAEQMEVGNVYTTSNYPKEPQTPEEVLGAWVFLCDQGEYSSADRLVTDRFVRSYGSSEALWVNISNGRPLKKASLEKIDPPLEPEDTKVAIDVLLSFEDEDGSEFFGSPSFRKENGLWKMQG